MGLSNRWASRIVRFLILLFYVVVLLFSFRWGNWILFLFAGLGLLVWITVDLQQSRQHLPEHERNYQNKQDLNLATSCLVWVVALFLAFFAGLFIGEELFDGVIAVLVIMCVGFLLFIFLETTNRIKWISKARERSERFRRIVRTLLFLIRPAILIITMVRFFWELSR